MTGPMAVRTEGLTKRFGDVVALDRLDLEVAAGEVFGFLGPNGAGKTTTIRLLLDFLRPTSGRIWVCGRPPRDSAIRRRIGYLPAELHVDARYTTREVVAYFAALRGAVDHGRVDVLLQRFDLDPGRPFGQLSTGNKRKVGIVQAFMHRCDLLLLDEPTTGLDPLLQHEFTELARETAAEGTTIFLSSHALPEVELLADRVGIMKHGRLIALDHLESMRAQARQRIDLHLSNTTDDAVQRFGAVHGVVAVEVTGSVVQVVVEGDVDPLIKAAAELEVRRIVTHDGDLEDVFLTVYRSQP